jgi:hypothetical protein
MLQRTIELWADSFHEGEWACTQIGNIVTAEGGSHQVYYESGFIPKHIFSGDEWQLTVTVYGSYRSWSPIPSKIDDLLAWGKPDFIAYDADADTILFAVEETAAVPTGNQALQRCERLYGSARQRIPYWYLLSEFGQHRDGGIRRDSIWPTVMAIKMSLNLHTPCVVLHYSDLENPEDYTAGTGLLTLFQGLVHMLLNHVVGRDLLANMADILTPQYRDMINFINSQWANMIDYLPGESALSRADLPGMLAMITTNVVGLSPTNWPSDFLTWPLRSGLPQTIQRRQAARSLLLRQ